MFIVGVLGALGWALISRGDILPPPPPLASCFEPFRNANQATEIIDACDAVIENEPENADAWIAKAQAHAVRGDDDEAANAFSEVFELVPIPEIENFSSLTPQERQVAFLQPFWREFQSVVVNESGMCFSAKDVYKVPLDIYREISVELDLGRDVELDREREFFAILELAHFISERDGDYALAKQLYEILLGIDSTSINALLGRIKVELMANRNLDLAESFLDEIDALYGAEQVDIRIKTQYHRASILARNEQYEDAVAAYDSILMNRDYGPVLDKYDRLEISTFRDKAFALYASGKYDAAVQVFGEAIGALEASDDITGREREDREKQLTAFQNKARDQDRQLQNYIDYGYVFSQFIAHETESESHAFFEHEHDKFYGCMQDTDS